ncbi:HNH endonuclease [Solibacillus sp. FSL H8-0538]|uniref:HNH endonuclease n=1 Tax=Solibacillus sp. FSL H8-0538 TaxID=2921400 RepID=UPI0030F5B993
MLAIKKHGLDCYACGFNFKEVYGELGKDFIEEAVEFNPETDLITLYANCYRMIHKRKDKILSVDELKGLIRKQDN